MDRPEHSPTTASLASRDISPKPWSTCSGWIVRWLLFFLICLGLGYSALERYDPRIAAGLSGSPVYYPLGSGEGRARRGVRVSGPGAPVGKPLFGLGRKVPQPAGGC